MDEETRTCTPPASTWTSKTQQRRLNEGFSMSSFEGFSSNLALFFLDKSTNNLEACTVVAAGRALWFFFIVVLYLNDLGVHNDQ